ncbi:hypothetical protein KPSB59_1480004 [Klebsiella quasipneumoniae subsp. quasipneumoniae]|nr:hypothetical protein KPSB59_1480004 [Klebsiella quasipneumoniae subsp. quasipneumoniae]
MFNILGPKNLLNFSPSGISLCLPGFLGGLSIESVPGGNSLVDDAATAIIKKLNAPRYSLRVNK